MADLSKSKVAHSPHTTTSLTSMVTEVYAKEMARQMDEAIFQSQPPNRIVDNPMLQLS